MNTWNEQKYRENTYRLQLWNSVPTSLKKEFPSYWENWESIRGSATTSIEGKRTFLLSNIDECPPPNAFHALQDFVKEKGLIKDIQANNSSIQVSSTISQDIITDYKKVRGIWDWIPFRWGPDADKQKLIRLQQRLDEIDLLLGIKKTNSLDKSKQELH